jgi:hypothetical protein
VVQREAVGHRDGSAILKGEVRAESDPVERHRHLRYQ